jgi:prepilin-type N-terminal cleavage/methylation domain-containing protein
MEKRTSRGKSSSQGFSFIELIIVVCIMGILAAIAVPSLLKARMAANEASALASVRLIVRSEVTYKTANLDGNYATLDQLFEQRHIDETLGVAPYLKNGYIFSVDLIPAASETPARFDVRADPIVHTFTSTLTGTGTRNFGANEAGAIYKTDDNTLVTFDPVTRISLGTATPAPE